MKKHFRTWIEINQSALRNNYNQFRRLIGTDCLLMAVVKSNAYGHGLINFSMLAEKLGVDWFGVDSIVEAESLRMVGIKKPVLVFGYTLQDKINDALNNNISLTVADIQTLKNLKNIIGRGNKLKIHLEIDTGMHRQGFFISEIPEVIKILESQKSILVVEGIYTHFSSARNPAFPMITFSQIKEFEEAIKLLESAGFVGFMKHAAATAGTIIFPQSHFDLVRVGIGLYGYWPSKETKEAFKDKIKLEPILSWKTIVSQIKDLPNGSKIGYDLTEAVNRPTKVAILPVGYWHGLPRNLSSVGRVLINGAEAKILGRVSMNMTSVDITDIKNAKLGDEVVLLGKSEKLSKSADDLAYLSDTINYEIITRINPLIKRVVV